MKKLSKFALLAIISSLLCSALVVGCGGGNDEEPAAPANKPAKDKDGE